MTRFALAVTAFLAAAYAYVAWRLASGAWSALALAVPFLLVWVLPAFYWGSSRSREGFGARVIQHASHLSMAWVSFIVVLTLARDVLLLATLSPALSSPHFMIANAGVPVVVAGSLLAMAIGAATAFRGPRIERVDIPIAGLHADLEGFRIVQISDLHVGPSIGRRYVDKVVALSRSLNPDIVVLTGDIVDGPVPHLAHDVAPLAGLSPAYFVLGNHDCYSGAEAWMDHFRQLGMTVLVNSHTVLRKGAARLLVGGVVDPAYGRLPPQITITEQADLRLLLAHNPRLAKLGAAAGFDLQLSGHTHAGQFFPWTLAVRLVHAPHVSGLSQEGRMQVYVSAGTGTWGPPVRFGTNPELTLLRLVRA
ncbi:MAG TPA: metallophosphoesterase [Burkholderiales bacterium]|nr:metallophosphoesterase [Burkholderiales bacterium]